MGGKLTIEEVRGIMESVRFPFGMSFRVIQVDYASFGKQIRVSYRTQLPITKVPELDQSGDSMLYSTDGCVLDTNWDHDEAVAKLAQSIRDTIHRGVLHEADEWLKVDDRWVTSPHGFGVRKSILGPIPPSR